VAVLVCAANVVAKMPLIMHCVVAVVVYVLVVPATAPAVTILAVSGRSKSVVVVIG
jgi:hypothetical protein